MEAVVVGGNLDVCDFADVADIGCRDCGLEVVRVCGEGGYPPLEFYD